MQHAMHTGALLVCPVHHVCHAARGWHGARGAQGRGAVGALCGGVRGRRRCAVRVHGRYDLHVLRLNLSETEKVAGKKLAFLRDT